MPAAQAPPTPQEQDTVGNAAAVASPAQAQDGPQQSPALVTDLASGHFVQNRITAVQGVAKNLYHKMEDAGSHNSLVRLGLNTFEKGASWLNPSLQRLGSLSKPMVQTLDGHISGAYNRLDNTLIRPAQGQLRTVPDKAQAVKTTLVNFAWFQRVDAALRGQKKNGEENSDVNAAEELQRTTERVTFSLFYTAAIESFLRLEDKTYEEFISDLRTKLQDTQHYSQDKLHYWDERLVAPAKVFWSSAHQRVKKGLDPQKMRIGASYNDTTQQAKELFNNVHAKVATSFNKAFDKDSVVGTNARALYGTALKYYEQATQNEPVVAVTDLVSGMKEKLQAGGDWKEGLHTPLVELFTKAKAAAVAARTSVQEPVEAAIQPVMTQVSRRVDDAKALVSRSVAAGMQTALVRSEQALDYLLPQEGQEQAKEQEKDGEAKPAEERTVTFMALRESATKRLRRKATVQLGALRQLSSTRVKSLIHVDLIAYAEEVIDKTNTRAIAPTRKRAADALKLVSGRAHKATTDTKSAMDRAARRINALSAEQKKHLRLALQAARDRAVAVRSALPVHAREVKRRAIDAAVLSWQVVSSHRIGDIHRDVLALTRQTVGIDAKGDNYKQVLAAYSALGLSVKSFVLMKDQLEQPEAQAQAQPQQESVSVPKQPSGVLETLPEDEREDEVVDAEMATEVEVETEDNSALLTAPASSPASDVFGDAQEQEIRQAMLAEEEQPEEEQEENMSVETVDATLIPPASKKQRSSMGQGKM